MFRAERKRKFEHQRQLDIWKELEYPRYAAVESSCHINSFVQQQSLVVSANIEICLQIHATSGRSNCFTYHLWFIADLQVAITMTTAHC